MHPFLAQHSPHRLPHKYVRAALFDNVWYVALRVVIAISLFLVIIVVVTRIYTRTLHQAIRCCCHLHHRRVVKSN